MKPGRVFSCQVSSISTSRVFLNGKDVEQQEEEQEEQQEQQDQQQQESDIESSEMDTSIDSGTSEAGGNGSGMPSMPTSDGFDHQVGPPSKKCCF